MTDFNPLFQFGKATRAQSKASILIEGLSGKGKSGLALTLGYYLANKDWTKVFDIDTENNSIQLFTDLPAAAGMKFENFQIANFTPDMKYKPSHYQQFKEVALNAGANVVINDSISHAWTYEGGILDLVAELKKTNDRYKRDSYAAWGDDQIITEKQKLFQLFRDSRCHIISTVRVKEKMEYDRDDNGKAILKSLGEQEIMQADIKYEPDLVLSMVSPGKATTSTAVHPKAMVKKSRYAILEEGQEYEFTPSLCEQIRDYLEEGASPEELLEKQRLEYVSGIKEFLDSHKTQVNIWKLLKEEAGYADTKLEDMPLNVLKPLFIKLTVD